MKHPLQAIAAVTLFLAAAIAPAVANAASPVGKWMSGTGESSYEVTLCGDGTQLCAKLVWLREDTRSKETLPYLNTFLVEKAKQVDDNRWKGKVHIFGQTLNGTITLARADRIDLEGCLFVFCKSFELKRIDE
jgi:uncharacterized protein (DUF2147 family)